MTAGKLMTSSEITTILMKNQLSTTEEFVENEERMTAGYVYIIIEFAYLLLFALSAFMLRKYKFMKTDDDAVTIHHRRHYDMMKEQQKELIEAQDKKENFLMAPE